MKPGARARRWSRIALVWTLVAIVWLLALLAKLACASNSRAERRWP
jgi:hypothetical protein